MFQKKIKSTSSSTAANVSLIRAQIVPNLSLPAIVAVTSSLHDDGAQQLSSLLSESFHSCGETTLLVYFSNEGERLLRLGQGVGRDLQSEIKSHIIKRGDMGADLLRVFVAENGA